MYSKGCIVMVVSNIICVISKIFSKLEIENFTLILVQNANGDLITQVFGDRYKRSLRKT